MSLEERHSEVQLEENTANRPQIARLLPVQLCNLIIFKS